MQQKKAYKYRIYPTAEQVHILARTFGCCRYVYNWALRQRTDAYKRCFDCGHVLDTLSLDVRIWTCPECGVIHDRDINAAKNIHAAGLTVFDACGEAVRPGRAKARVGKPR